MQKKKMRKNETKIKEVEEKYIPKTDDELKGIAKDLWSGKIFSDRHISSLNEDPNVLGMIFMPMVFMSSKTRKKLSNLKVNFIYEYFSKASPRAINGMPIFFSCKILTEPETKKMFEYYEKFKQIADTL